MKELKELKFSNINENDVIEEIESLEIRNEFWCVINACPINSHSCITNTIYPCAGVF